MARLYTNENVPIEAVHALRRLGHDVLTSYEAGNANASISDDRVLAFADLQSRVFVTNNRRDFIRLHRQGAEHVGVIAFTSDPEPLALANRIDQALMNDAARGRYLVRINADGFRFEI